MSQATEFRNKVQEIREIAPGPMDGATAKAVHIATMLQRVAIVLEVSILEGACNRERATERDILAVRCRQLSRMFADAQRQIDGCATELIRELVELERAPQVALPL